MESLTINKNSLSSNSNIIGDSLKEFLDRKVEEYNQPSFIENDPVSIPHMFARKQDIEIAGFFAAILAWGNRTTIINKCKELMKMMDDEPYEFIISHNQKDLKPLLQFKHRTFNSTDLLYFIEVLRFQYTDKKNLKTFKEPTLESAFLVELDPADDSIEDGLNGFYHRFFSLEHVPNRTKKHIASPQKKSSCKRLNMFLRWMVRKDDKGVDFGIWENIKPSQLICPVDLHVARVARRFGLISRKQTDWLAALELTSHLKRLDANDPAKYDFALFGLGVMERF
ncbi:MAG: TIGR02757 family protein [Bacteroidetes bacterium]|nr:MAG: TIGR02757 family protein [Bacteroidota bacterium]